MPKSESRPTPPYCPLRNSPSIAFPKMLFGYRRWKRAARSFAASHVVDATSRPLVGASVTLNRELYTATTNASGNFSFAGIPAGAWEIAVTVGAKTTTKNVTVAKDAIAPADLSL